MTFHPNTDLVAVTWVSTIAGISPSQVGTTLPQDNTTWAASGFVTVAAIGGTPDLYLPVKRPVVEVNCWAVNPSSGKPPWGKANQIAEIIRAHCDDVAGTSAINRKLTLPSAYYPAQLFSAYLLSEPRRSITSGATAIGDEASYARYQFDLQLHWRTLP